jgi:hypothetical protein
MTVSTTGGTGTFDMQAFAAQSEAKTIATMQLNQRQEDMAEIKKYHTAKLEQDMKNAESVADFAVSPSKIGSGAAKEFKQAA